MVENVRVNESEVFDRSELPARLISASIVSVKQLDEHLKGLNPDDPAIYELECVRDDLISIIVNCVNLLNSEVDALTIVP